MGPYAYSTYGPTMILNSALALDLWYTALRQEFGLRLVLADPKDIRKVQNILYETRVTAADPDLDAIAVNLPTGGKEIWLTKKATDLSEGPPTRRLVPHDQ